MNQTNQNSKSFIQIVKFIMLICINASCNPSDLYDGNIQTVQSNLILPSTPYNYSSPLLPNFFKNQFVTIQDNTPNDNQVTDWGATLGRVLFYDKQLSKNHTISCASCHQQAIGFSDTTQFSKGFNAALTQRHSMSLINATYYLNGRFFWDERAGTLEEQVLQPIQDSIEMGLSLDSLILRLENTTYYAPLFQHAFGNKKINAIQIARALAQFVRSIVSFQSKYDIGRNQVIDRTLDFPNYTAEENLGKKIFMTHTKVNCFGCHNTDAIITDNPRNNGISFTNKDQGIYIHTKLEQDLGKFKAPSLRNVSLRKRYMHDGSFDGINQVIEHYNHGIQPNPNLDSHLKNLSTNLPAQMNLSQAEINALKAFLETLTDYEIIQDVKFSNPFK